MGKNNLKNIKLIKSALRKIIARLTNKEDIKPGGQWHKAYVDLQKLCDEINIPYTLGFGEFDLEGPYFKLEDNSCLYAGNEEKYIEDFFYLNIPITKLLPGEKREFVGTTGEAAEYLTKRYRKRKRKFQGKF